MATFEEISNSDYFFFYGEGIIPLQDEAQHDIFEQVIQPRRTYFYNRQEAIGITEFENYPSSLVAEILTRFRVAQGISFKNTLVTDGSNGQLDRRVVVSQNTVSTRFVDDLLDIGIQYFLFASIEEPQQINIPVR